jgi:hypothetical protein
MEWELLIQYLYLYLVLKIPVEGSSQIHESAYLQQSELRNCRRIYAKGFETAHSHLPFLGMMDWYLTLVVP